MWDTSDGKGKIGGLGKFETGESTVEEIEFPTGLFGASGGVGGLIVKGHFRGRPFPGSHKEVDPRRNEERIWRRVASRRKMRKSRKE